MGTKGLLAVVIAATVGTWACSTDSGTDLPAGPASADAPPAITAAPTARYRVTFESTWSQQTHPNDWPSDAHYSRLIGGTHRDPVRFWSAGALASEGIRRMAEEGRTTPMDEEVRAAISAGTAQHLIEGGALNFTPGTLELELEISRDYPLVTLVTMVAPSPDWFVGVSALPLLEGDWLTERRVTLAPWDAGTDNGVTFRSPNRPADPRQPIHLIEDGPFRVDTSVPPLGTFTFRRLS